MAASPHTARRAAPAAGAAGTAAGPPVIVLGVSRSGTTLLRELLNGHPDLAIPTESYFIPQLVDRHGIDAPAERVLADLPRIARIREWGVDADAVRARLAPDARLPDVVAAVYAVQAAARGRTRWGDKTPLYMQELDLLHAVFPDARYVHIVRDGRDAAISFLAMKRKPRFNASRPRGLLAFACQWRHEIRAARRFGAGPAAGRLVELRYEDLLADPASQLRRACEGLALPFDHAMLVRHRGADTSALQDHRRLSDELRPREARWRREMAPRHAELFEAAAGDLLDELGYPRAHRSPSSAALAVGAAARTAYAARLAAWRGSLAAYRRTPAWRVRQAWVRRDSGVT